MLPRAPARAVNAVRELVAIADEARIAHQVLPAARARQVDADVGDDCPGRPESATTRLERNTASSMACVTNRTVVRSDAEMPSSSSCSRCRVMASTAANGSSISSTAGLLASTRATAARWRMPPESWCGIFLLEALEADEVDEVLGDLPVAPPSARP